MATIKLQKQASLLKSYTLNIFRPEHVQNELFLEWLIPAFTKCGSIELHQSSFTASKNPTFPKVFCQQMFQSVKDLLRSGRPLKFITEHKFNHKFEIAVIQITLEYYRLASYSQMPSGAGTDFITELDAVNLELIRRWVEPKTQPESRITNHLHFRFQN